jgi:hypothetical protein
LILAKFSGEFGCETPKVAEHLYSRCPGPVVFTSAFTDLGIPPDPKVYVPEAINKVFRSTYLVCI